MNQQNDTNLDKSMDEKWDDTLNSEEGLELLDSMAAQAFLDFENGEFTPMNQEVKE